MRPSRYSILSVFFVVGLLLAQGCWDWTVPDRDRDGVRDQADNCPDDPNPEQEDRDDDGFGDACDPIICDGITCSGHGRCVQNESGEPECICDTGHHAQGLECILDVSNGDADVDADVGTDADPDPDADSDIHTDADRDEEVGTDGDCPAVCGDNDCTHDENAESCPEDCPATCRDGFCTHDETRETCAHDCCEEMAWTGDYDITDEESLINIGNFTAVLGTLPKRAAGPTYS